jgi:hypothetical protein
MRDYTKDPPRKAPPRAAAPFPHDPDEILARAG